MHGNITAYRSLGYYFYMLFILHFRCKVCDEESAAGIAAPRSSILDLTGYHLLMQELVLRFAGRAIYEEERRTGNDINTKDKACNAFL